MSGLGMVLNTAKLAVMAQQVGINVTGNNIANANTAGYSRQTATMSNLDPIRFGNNLLGTGVDVTSVTRTADAVLSERLNNQQSSLATNEQMDAYMATLEGLFNENSDTSLSTQISEFWNSWQDLSDSPAGTAERMTVYDTAGRLAEQFDWLDANMTEMGSNLTQEVESGVSQVNTLAKQIAAMNVEIAAASVTAHPNDQLDKRDQLISQLSQLLDINTFEQANGTVSIVTSAGNSLVYGADSYEMKLQQDRVIALDANGGTVDLTDRLKGGKIGGWLEMRDSILPKFKGDLNAVAGEFIWSVNQVHSQGVGLDYFSDAMTGASKTDASHMFSTLDFGDRIDYTGEFKVWTENTATGTHTPFSVDMGISSAAVGTVAGAAPGSFQYRLTVDTAGTVGATGIDPVISWERFNPDGTSAGVTGTVTVTDVDTLSGTVDGLAFDISAGDLYAGNTFTINTDAAGLADNLAVTASGKAKSASDTYIFNVKDNGTNGKIGTDTIEMEWHNGSRVGTFTLKPGTTAADVDGMTVNFASGTVFDGNEFTITTDASGNATKGLSSDWHWTLDSFAGAFNAASGGRVTASVADNRLTLTPASGYGYAFSDDATKDSGVAAALGLNTFFEGSDASSIEVNSVLDQKDFIAAGRIDSATGEFAVGDNSNALALADLQYSSRSVAQWNYGRGDASTSRVSTATIEGYYQGMIGSMGIKSASIAQDSKFSKAMVEQITEQKDSLSGVSLDEEMVNLMKYQHAFVAASKLLTIADEMMQTLLQSR